MMELSANEFIGGQFSIKYHALYKDLKMSPDIVIGGLGVLVATTPAWIYFYGRIIRLETQLEEREKNTVTHVQLKKIQT